MVIKKLVDRELTPEEIESIKTFRKYTDGVSFACLRSRVMVIMDDVPSNDLEQLKESALSRMEEALCTHPDFVIYNMSDGHVLLIMPSGLYAFSEHPCRDNMMLNLSLRAECLDAAEKMEIIAIAYEED